MNRFLEHHDSRIRFVYSYFDRILLNAVIQPLQRPSTIVWFLKEQQGVRGRLNQKFFRRLSGDDHDWVRQWAKQQNVEIVEPPDVRRENWVQPYYQQMTQDEGVAVILKTFEQANVAVSQPTTGEPHIELKPRRVWQYYFYVRDSSLGPLWLRACPLPASEVPRSQSALTRNRSNSLPLLVESFLLLISIPRLLRSSSLLRQTTRIAAESETRQNEKQNSRLFTEKG